MSTIHISINAETIFNIFGVNISNSLATTIITTIVLTTFSLIYFASFRKNPFSSFVTAVNIVLKPFYKIIESILGENTKFFFPLSGTFLLFILIGNWMGLIPGFGSIGFLEEGEKFVPLFRAPTADLNTTIALALISVGLTQYFGIKAQHFSYFKKFINFKGPIDFFVGILETISEFAKIISFAFRLFGNIFAGEVLLVVISALVPVIFPSVFLGMEVFVGAVQALVFSLLTTVFISMAVSHSSH